MLALVLIVVVPGRQAQGGRGTLLVMVSSRAGDRLGSTDLSLLGRGGEVDLGSHGGRVPQAPDTLRLVQASIAPGTYSGLRLGGVSLPAAITVTRGQVLPVLVGVEDGRPLAGGVWAGNDDFNLGLSELSGQKTPIQDFNLVDEQGRPFTAASLLGSDALIAAFHTTCHETCPIYTGLFLQLRDRVPAGTRLVEVTTDPVTDTPQVLRQYAAETGAGWTLATGSDSELARFWSQFGTLLSGEDEHTSTLVLVDRHGYVRVVYRGVPDVGGSLPAPLGSQLSPTGAAELHQKGLEWGAPQVLDALHSISSLAAAAGDTAGGQAPDFKLQTLDGGTVSLDGLRGKPVVLNFFASWCPPCRSELPLLQRDAAAHPGVSYLLVATRDDPAQARALLGRLGVTVPTAAKDPDGAVSDAYGAFGLPTTVFIRRDGTIASRVARQLDAATLAASRSALEAG